jgi:hypothetical protein
VAGLSENETKPASWGLMSLAINFIGCLGWVAQVMWWMGGLIN